MTSDPERVGGLIETAHSMLAGIDALANGQIIGETINLAYGQGQTLFDLVGLIELAVGKSARATYESSQTGEVTRYVADISALGPIRKKTRICIADATNAQYHRGPGYSARHRWDYCGILASTDFVALDTVLADILKAKRVEKGLPPYFKPLRHLERAVQLRLGCGDLKKSNRLEIEV